MRKSNALLLLAALGGCASSTADPPARTWDERQERIEQQEEELAQRERAERLKAQRERAADADRVEPSAESRDPSTVSVNDSSLATGPTQQSLTTAPQSEPGASSSVDKKADARALVTPLDQGNDKRDLEITQQIRKTVMDDGSLSFNAKNVKIITKNGQVTLRGEVASAKERTSIETAARGVAGATNVSNQLEVNP